jgi:hydroxymethylglutaryl-CoA reductase
MAERSSELPGFHKKSVEERRRLVAEFAGLTKADSELLISTNGVDVSVLDRMVENVIGTFSLPLAVATNFRVNDRDYLVPMAIEEASVVAAASNAAKMARAGGGFHGSMSDPVMIGQVQLLHVPDPHGATHRILAEEGQLLDLANSKDPMLHKVGGGARKIEIRVLHTVRGPMVVVHLLVDVRDAMGANAVNTMVEALAPELARLSGGRSHLRILSNLAIHRLARAWAVFPKEVLASDSWTGDDVVEGILDAWCMAAHDPFRCATHNKGVMNGVSAVAIATGNDFRALEAGAHSYAAWKAREGEVISPLTVYEKNSNGDLVGSIELPMAVGTIGGTTAVHPTAKLAVKILGVSGAKELGTVMAAVGLAQNFAALRALATDGIQKGHMTLHARNVAISAGARPEEADKIAETMIAERTVRIDRAKELLDKGRRS